MLERDEKLVILYNSILETSNLKTKSMIEFYENKYKFYMSLISNHMKYKPLKIFKKEYDAWQQKLTILENKYNDAFDKYVIQCNILFDLH